MSGVPQTAEERAAVRNGLLRQAKEACIAGRHDEEERVLLEYYHFNMRCQLHNVRLNPNAEPEDLADFEAAVRMSDAALKALTAGAAASDER